MNYDAINKFAPKIIWWEVISLAALTCCTINDPTTICVFKINVTLFLKLFKQNEIIQFIFCNLELIQLETL